VAAAAPVLGKVSENYAAGLTLHVGKSTVVEVPFSGAPQPSATWKWNGQKLPDPARTKADTLQNTTTLTLNRVERSDAGTYSLLLENNTGKATFAIKVKVIGKYNSAAQRILTAERHNHIVENRQRRYFCWIMFNMVSPHVFYKHIFGL